MFINGRKLSLEYVVLVPVEALMRAEVRDVLYLLTWCNSSAAAFKDLLDAQREEYQRICAVVLESSFTGWGTAFGMCRMSFLVNG